jgi:hypothetical protein
MSKTYIDYWYCPNCKRQLEYVNMPKFDEKGGPLCSECAHKLIRDYDSHWRPSVLVDFS